MLALSTLKTRIGWTQSLEIPVTFISIDCMSYHVYVEMDAYAGDRYPEVRHMQRKYYTR